MKADGSAVVSPARSLIGVPYSSQDVRINDTFRRVDGSDGFDCSGLSRYAVYKGTAKITVNNSKCTRVEYTTRQPGDLVFFPGQIGIFASAATMIEATYHGEKSKKTIFCLIMKII